MSAFDIGVASPHAHRAGEDCCETMRQRKLDTYRVHLQSLQDMGINYIPAVFSTYGREHPATTQVLESLARRAARKNGMRDYTQVLRAARANIGVALASRHANMIHAAAGLHQGYAASLVRVPDGPEADDP